MLGEILSKDYCASCLFCCVFRVRNLWETPVFSAEEAKKICRNPRWRNVEFRKTVVSGTECMTWVKESDLGKNPDDEVPCPFLDMKTGCALDGDLKPLECKIWPYRVMLQNGKRIMAVSRLCPGISGYSKNMLLAFVRDKILPSLRKQNSEFGTISEIPLIPKQYTEDYEPLFEF